MIVNFVSINIFRDQGSILNPIPDIGIFFRSGIFKKVTIH